MNNSSRNKILFKIYFCLPIKKKKKNPKNSKKGFLGFLGSFSGKFLCEQTSSLSSRLMPVLHHHYAIVKREVVGRGGWCLQQYKHTLLLLFHQYVTF